MFKKRFKICCLFQVMFAFSSVSGNISFERYRIFGERQERDRVTFFTEEK